MFSQRIINILNSANCKNHHAFNRSKKIFSHNRKLHIYNGSCSKLNKLNKCDSKYSFRRSTCLHNYLSARCFKTDIITTDNIVTSPYADVLIPDELLYECVWNNVDKWPDKIAIVSVYCLIFMVSTFSQL